MTKAEQLIHQVWLYIAMGGATDKSGVAIYEYAPSPPPPPCPRIACGYVDGLMLDMSVSSSLVLSYFVTGSRQDTLRRHLGTT